MDELDSFIENAFSLVMSGYYATGQKRTVPVKSLTSSIASADRIPVIAEFKRRTPSVRDISSDADITERLTAFANAGICGFSILTEPHRFDGSLANISAASAFGLPVIMKDFIIATDQVDAAYRLGADAVLLIMDIFERSRFNIDVLMEDIHTAGMEAVLEVNSSEQFAAAMETEADIIGINNRNLSDLTLEERRVEKVLAGAAKDRPVIGMSGVTSPLQVMSMLDAGADAVLVGTSLMGGSTALLDGIKEAVLKRRK
ncbi:MAG: indole-3-glycerol-phosphate synthase [Thermoplasmata archaeon]|nr:indole-3-glycerol-phosphate synthase [Candidatus Sysuiplasma acidicola]MBX8636884.1 indole-3-glycerol-phosphate synthase [Candidatus Sysuiplasma acidicola]MBX8645268.1 indole-3-glycerol-phosphate synthase [Candidatus Sysuiplasma acidicola]MDH2906180.1 indole-3-glycerol-phosphate synthase [Methanomassiliicoccales archaeon]